MSTEMTPERIMQLGLGFWGSKTLLSAVELGLFTALGSGPLTEAEISKRLQLHGRCAKDFLDALVALGMLTRTGERYTNTPESGFFLDKSKPSYIGRILEMSNTRLYAFWGSLTEALRTGKPQNEAKKGGNPFDSLYADPENAKLFLASMTGISLPAAQVIAAKFPWGRYHTFADLGAAQGGLPVQVALAHPHLRGIGFDLPVVKDVFEQYVSSFGLADRLRFQPGSFFADPLPLAEVYVMGHILHDWDLEQKMMLLRKAHAALPPGGALIVYDAMIDDERRSNAFGLLMSLNMLIETPGGFDYTGADCRRWMTDAGFRDTRVEPLAGPDSMVVGIK